MADNEKIEAGWMDFPVSGGTQRTWFKDVEARAAIQQLDPASVINVSDITALTDEQCEGLVAGGSVNKSDSTGKHSYKVTYKSATGMCLTYADADNVETVSYDKTNGHWVYNSTDITAISEKAEKSTMTLRIRRLQRPSMEAPLMLYLCLR